ncbi:site-specific integrase [Streptomyces sp. NPDC018955]|uniref:site-specific integrase n=1 Tax=Streptomyces sp. NPDC018955 TaxID=3365055 RepID=UPI0037B4BD5A
METTYDVKVYKILAYKGARKNTYTVRWVVAGKRWREPFDTVALAEGFRSELIRATGKGEAFVVTTGLPVSHRSKSAAMSWYKSAVEYVDARWSQLGGNSRKNMAKTLTATTIALLRAELTQFAPAAVRTALREWAFNTNRRPDAPRDVAAILRRVERNSLPVSAWEDPEKADQVPQAIDTRLDGRQAAAWSRKRNRRILNVVMKYAVRRRILRRHIQDERLRPGDLLFQGESGGVLAGSVIRRAWRSARKAVLPPHVFESPTGRRVYDNRHRRLTKWLNDGVPPAQVAEWAGNSVAVLLATYARCVDGQLPDLKRRLEAAGDLPEASGAG